MSSPKKLAGALAVLLLVLSTRATTAVQTLIPAGSVWKYNDSGVAQSGWTGVSFTDTSWSSGQAQLGYGDGDEITTISYGTNANSKRITSYRRSFTLANPASIAALTLRYLRDDGAVIYLNGTEVVRSNMPTGTIAASTLASSSIGGTDESAWTTAPVSVSLLRAGTNVVAVEIHQNAANSTDVSFDLELSGTEAAGAPPAVTLVSPLNQGTVNSTSVSFSATATSQVGLLSATLFVGGPPATVVLSGAAQVQDAEISAATPTTPAGSGAAINVDGQSPHAHGLIKFPTLVGSGAGQVPAGAMVTSATLRLNCTNSGNTMQAYRLTQDWVEDQATWNQRSSGVNWGVAGADGAASNAGVAAAADCTVTGLRNVDLTSFVQQWVTGSPNYGIVLTDTGTDGIDFSSSESATSPSLTVVYKSNQTALGTQSISGTSASMTFSAPLPLGTYFWNVQVTDINNQSSLAGSDFQLTVDVAAPNPPVLVLPTNGATNVPTDTQLRAAVSDPSNGSVTATATLRAAAAPEFTIIAMPDTQHYSEAYPDIFTSQTQWIVNNKIARNIVFVTHEGDVVEHQGTILEWQRANTSMSMLDGVVPYGLGPGNHDVPTTNFNIYFPWTRYAGQPWYGGHYQNTNDNNYELFSAGGMDFVIAHLVYCPSSAVVSWADQVFKAFPDRIGIMTTHAYLDESANRTPHGCTNTQYLWDGLAVPNPNLHFMLSGHVHAESRRADVVNGHPVFQMLADYQDRANGGEGWLRILRFVPADNKIYVQTYSPWLNRYETDADSEFTLDFPMAGSFSTVGATTIASGATAVFSPANLQPSTEYEWQVTVTNANGKSVTGPVWTFTTAAGAPPPPPPNQPPVATGESHSVQSGNTLTVSAPGVLSNDTDPENGGLTAELVANVAHGTLALASNGGFTYTPTAGYSGPDSFAYRANDGQATSNSATVTLTVTVPPNQPPTATGESHSVQQPNTLTVAAPGVLSNDSDPDGNPITAQLVANVTHGTLNLAANGGFTYTPTAGYTGPDAFTYRANDGQANSNTVTVSLTVTPAPNTAPTATGESHSVQQPNTLTVAAPGVLSNDSDPDGNPITAQLMTDVAHGILALAANGGFTYTPTAGYTGPDAFTYRAHDGQTNSNTVTVNITVTPAPNQPPTATGDSHSVQQPNTLTVAAPGVLSNDSDPDGNPITAQLVANVTHGTLNLAANGGFTYTPTAGYTGPDAFTYRANDGQANSNTVTVSLTVTPAPNTAPTATGESHSVQQPNTLTVAAPGVLSNDSDPDGNPLTTQLVANVTHGTLNLAANGGFTYTPTAGYTGPDAFTYRAHDGQTTSNTVTVSLTVTPAPNQPPTATGDSHSVQQPNTLTVAAPGVLSNDSDPDGNPITAQLVANVTHGTLNLAANGGFTYTPTAGYTGPDAFTYRAHDGQTTSNTVTVSLTVTPAPNTAPTATGESHSVQQPNTLTVAAPGVLSNDSDPDGNPLTTQLVANVTHGTLNLAANGGFTYTPTAGYTGPDAFTYRAHDGQTTSNTVTVSLTVTPAPNQPPTATGDSHSVQQPNTLTVAAPGVLSNDSDPDGNPITAQLVANVTHGTLNLAANGGFTYTPTAGYTGPDAFTYRAHDGQTTSNTVTVNISITPAPNQPPTATGESHSVQQPNTLTVAAPGVLSNDSDPDGNPITAQLVANVTHGTLNLAANGGFTYTPTAGYTGPDAFTYRAHDGQTTSNTVTVNITVTPAPNQPPVATGESHSVQQPNTLTVAAPGVLSNDSDPDGNPITAQLVANVTHGTLNLAANGGFTYTPTAGYTGPDAFTYRAHDGQTTSNTVTVSLTVTPAPNQPPTATGESHSVQQPNTLTVAAPGVLSNDSDPDGNPLTTQLVANVTHGTLNLAANGGFTYTPTAGYSGPDAFTYRAHDGQTTSNTVTVNITITPAPNTAPTANGESYSVQSGKTLTVTAPGILSNDTDPESNPLTTLLVANVTHGTLSLAANGGLTYTPTGGYTGPDGFTYRANDGQATSVVATVNITVTAPAPNSGPIAADDSYTVQSGNTLTVAAPGVLANDSDADGDPMIASVFINPTNGTLALAPNGGFTYTPAAGFSGQDWFAYRAGDGQVLSGAVIATISVTSAGGGTTILSASFNSGADSFTYVDDTFKGTNQPSYASGTRVTSGGVGNTAALRVLLGGVNSTDILNMSGGWRRTFTLSSAAVVTLSFSYNLNQGPEYESNEFSQLLATINGVLVPAAPGYVAQVTGNGNGGTDIATGWQQVTLSLGSLSAGTHTLTLGGFNNGKTDTNEQTTVLIDDVLVTRP